MMPGAAGSDERRARRPGSRAAPSITRAAISPVVPRLLPRAWSSQARRSIPNDRRRFLAVDRDPTFAGRQSRITRRKRGCRGRSRSSSNHPAVCDRFGDIAGARRPRIVGPPFESGRRALRTHRRGSARRRVRPPIGEKRVRPRVSRRPLSRSPHRDRRPQLASTEAINAGWSLLVLSPRRRVCWGRHGTCFSLSAVRRRLAWRAVTSEMEAAERSCCVGGVGAI